MGNNSTRYKQIQFSLVTARLISKDYSIHSSGRAYVHLSLLFTELLSHCILDRLLVKQSVPIAYRGLLTEDYLILRTI